MDDDSSRRRLPPGSQPYDPANGMRVGAFVGAAAGAVLGALTGLWWSIPIGAVVCGAIGHRSERRRIENELRDRED